MHWRDDPSKSDDHIRQIDAALREAYYRDPFQPVEIVLKDGRRLLVRHMLQFGFPPAFPAIRFTEGDNSEYYYLDDIRSVVAAKPRAARRQKQNPKRKAA